jgi:hypothetical protein
MSAQVQPAGQVEKLTLEKVTVLSAPPLCEVTASPASSVPVRLEIVMVEPATVLQVIPSLEI